MDNKTKIVASVIAGAALIGAGFAGAALVEPKVVEVEKTVEKLVEVPVEVVKEVPVEKVVEKIVEVDNGKLDAVLQHIYDNDGSVDYLTSDLKDSEVSQIADRVVFVNDLKAVAVSEAKKEIADLVDKEVVGAVTLDEDDVEKVKIDDEADEIVVDEIDFEDKDAELLVTGEFEHDDVDYDFEVRVVFKDGMVDEVELESVSEQ